MPYGITPQYDEEKSGLMSEPSKSTLQVRRRKVRECLKQLTNYSAYEELCKQIYGVDNDRDE